jgi:tRNA threonylcarbamoyladenosine biosynthesis protein TsaE
VILDEAQLVEWGRSVGRTATRPLVLALRGDLGAGKSVLARAVARGAGVEAAMPSPTFNLVYRYELEGGGSVWHVDLYRLLDEDEVWELGWREMGGPEDVVLIEWPERAERLAPTDRWDITLDPGPSPETRRLSASPAGNPPLLPEPGE